MKIYLVGGFVRDALLGKPSKDKDYVVTGASPEDMTRMGFEQVGASFPVFLHPVTKEEYALARTERKVSSAEDKNAHQSFSFKTEEVTLEEDLKRRDLTINAIAIDEAHYMAGVKQYIDPYGGLEDLKKGVLRHVSEAFAEDPLRVLRVARFAARFSNFKIAPETLNIMKEVAQTKEFKTLSYERVFKEMSSALVTEKPSIFFEVLKSVGAIEHFFPELHALFDVPQRPEYHPEGDTWVHTMLVLDAAAKFNNIVITYAALVHDLGKGVTPKEILPAHHGHEEAGVPLVEAFSDRLKVPNEWKEAGVTVTRYHLNVHRIETLSPSGIVRMFYSMDAFRKPHLVEILARASEADDFGKNKIEVLQGKILEKYFSVVKDLGFKDIRQDLKGEAISNEIRSSRVRKLKEYLKK